MPKWYGLQGLIIIIINCATALVKIALVCSPTHVMKKNGFSESCAWAFSAPHVTAEQKNITPPAIQLQACNVCSPLKAKKPFPCADHNTLRKDQHACS
jgi:hypothetical protein